MTLQLNLQKAARTLRVSLDKAGVAPDVKAELIFDMDVSGSFFHEHEEGTTSKLIARLVPYGMELDPDGQIDVFTFSDGRHNVHYVGTVTPEDCDNYIVRKVVGRVPGWNGGTDYSYVLERNLQHFGWLPTSEGGGFLSRFLGRPKAPEFKARKRSIVIFVTDGENSTYDHVRAARILEESEQRGDQVYFLFVGACEHEVDFGFIRTVAERYKNTGVVIIRDLDAFVELSDEQLNAQLLGPELIAWLKA
jgi:hypothetical protein